MNWNFALQRVKRLIRPSLTTLVFLLLAGCVLSGPVALTPKYEDPPPELTAPCQGPGHLTGNSARTVERDWKRDRVNQINCAERLDRLAEWYKQRDDDIRRIGD